MPTLPTTISKTPKFSQQPNTTQIGKKINVPVLESKSGPWSSLSHRWDGAGGIGTATDMSLSGSFRLLRRVRESRGGETKEKEMKGKIGFWNWKGTIEIIEEEEEEKVDGFAISFIKEEQKY